jgi:hypothetical protein
MRGEQWTKPDRPVTSKTNESWADCGLESSSALMCRTRPRLTRYPSLLPWGWSWASFLEGAAADELAVALAAQTREGDPGHYGCIRPNVLSSNLGAFGSPRSALAGCTGYDSFPQLGDGSIGCLKRCCLQDSRVL